jgi:drug/metabolite transporter (DMT)-like permease
MNWMIYALLIGSATFWGANFNVGKVAVDVMEPMSVVAWRFILAAICMVIILWTKERPSFGSIRLNLIKYAILGIVGIFGTNAFLFVGLKHSSPINASLIMATNPLVTVILSVFLLRDKIRVRQGIGIIISLIGVLFVITGGSIFKLHAVSTGDLLVLCGNICWALYGVLVRKYLKGNSPLCTSALTMLIGAICFIPFANFAHRPATGTVVTEAWLAIWFMAIFGSVLAYLWWNRGIAQIGANRTSIFFNLVPVSTMVITFLYGGNVLNVQLVGALVVLAGVILATLKMKQDMPMNAAQRLSVRSDSR